MRKHVMIFIGLLFALLISGCGGSSSTVTTISGITKEAITSTEVSGKTLYLNDISGTTKFVFSDTTFTSTFAPRTTGTSTSASGTWNITDGNIVLTVGTATQTFSCIQKETDYWLVFDVSSKQISRMSSTQPTSGAYYPTLMGGSIQGTPLTLAATPTVPTLSGSGLSQPMSITYADSFYYVADYANNRIQKVDPLTWTVTTFAGSGTAGSANGNGTGASFNLPSGITTDGANLYVVDHGSHTIRQIVISSQVVTTIAGTASSAGSIDATGSSARFNSPWGITTDGTNLYVADTGNYIIRKIRLSTHEVSTIAGSSGNSDTVEGTYTNARFVQPTRLTTDGSNLYVVDYKNIGKSSIRKIVIATGTVSTFAGVYGHLGGITTDGTYLYVGDNVITSPDNTNISYAPCIRQVEIASPNTTTTINISGTVPPYGLTIDDVNHHLYYTNSESNTISFN